MDEVKVTRAEIQEKIKELVQVSQDPEVVKNEVEDWLIEKECLVFEMNQILNDLTSYEEYRLIWQQ